MDKIKAEIITLKILVEKGKSEHFIWQRFAKIVPGYLDHKYENVGEEAEVNNLHDSGILEYDWKDWFSDM